MAQHASTAESDYTLTEDERHAIVAEVFGDYDSAGLFAAVEGVLKARLAEAWERGHFYCAAEEGDARCANPYAVTPPAEPS